jgi:hypothetical protein
LHRLQRRGDADADSYADADVYADADSYADAYAYAYADSCAYADSDRRGQERNRHPVGHAPAH